MLAVGLLTAATPLLLMIWMLLKLSQRGAVLFGQERIGYLGRPFKSLKIRTMEHPRGAAQFVWPLPGEDDARVTRIGRWLRRFRLDELPQLWNVLRGEMSLVGPRPTPPEEISILERAIPNYHLRHMVKGGITGWAQVNFPAPRTTEDARERLKYDLFYIKNMSLAMDLGILLKTAKRVLIGDAQVRAGDPGGGLPSGIRSESSVLAPTRIPSEREAGR